MLNAIMASGTTFGGVWLYAWPKLLNSLETRRDAQWAEKMGRDS